MFRRLLSSLRSLQNAQSLATFTSKDGASTVRRLHHFELGKLNHVAIAVPDLDKAVHLYRDVLGGTVSEPQELPEHGVVTVFVELGNTKIELLLPLGEKSPIEGFLKKNPQGGMHHICLEVDSIQGAISHVQESGVRTLGREPQTGAHGKPVIFLHPKDCGGVLVELEEA